MTGASARGIIAGKREPLKPLKPLGDLKEVLGALIRVPRLEKPQPRR